MQTQHAIENVRRPHTTADGFIDGHINSRIVNFDLFIFYKTDFVGELERREEEKSLSPAISIMKPILRYLQLLCENHNAELQVRNTDVFMFIILSKTNHAIYFYRITFILKTIKTTIIWCVILSSSLM